MLCFSRAMNDITSYTNAKWCRKMVLFLFFMITVIMIVYLSFTYVSLLTKMIMIQSSSTSTTNSRLSENFVKRFKYNVSALVFYGRRRYVEILNCYLEQNLIENGGLLSEVIFISKTKDENDIKYLHQLVAQHPRTYFIKQATNLGWAFDKHYRGLDHNRYYVKIDDDILYIHPNAIESMLEVKLTHPDALFISANVINHPNMGILHLHLRALLNTTNALPKSKETGIPICHWTKSNCANVHHLSFLKRIEENTLDAYVFPLWDMNAFDYQRWSINFILFKGNEVQDVERGDDEHQISIEIPEKYKKHSLAVGKALVVHFGYMPQRKDGLKDDKFVPKYRRIAQKVCNSTFSKRTYASNGDISRH